MGGITGSGFSIFVFLTVGSRLQDVQGGGGETS
jgi:hypothetical protein